MLFAASLNYSLKSDKWKDYGESSPTVALLHHQVTRVNMLTGQLATAIGG
jgi:hypothetical protein